MMWTIRRLVMAMMAMATAVALPTTAARAQGGLPGILVPVCFAPGDVPLSALLAGAPCSRDATRFGRGDFWAVSSDLSAVPADHDRVRFVSLWQDRVTLHALYADGVDLRFRIDGRGATRRIQLGAAIEQRLPPRPARLVRLAWHVEGSANLRGIVQGARLATADQSVAMNLKMGAFYAAFAGLCIALLVYNLALWAALRHPFHLGYCAMVAALLVYVFSSSGALGWTWPDIANNDRLRVNYITLGLAASAGLLFARSFFEKDVFEGWLGQAVNASIAAILATSMAYVLLAPWHIQLLDRAYAFAFLSEFAIIVPLLARAWRRRSNYLWLFAIAWATPIVFASLRTLTSFNLLPWSFWLDNSTPASMALEALLSSVAIAYRTRVLIRERDEAQRRESDARLLADSDPLTDLLNRRAFLSRAIGRPGDQMLILADIDHFKRVNETIGHDGGDEVLRVVSRTLRAVAPPDALVARMGGEEFGIVIPAGTMFDPGIVLEHLRAARMPYDLTVTASIGTCIGPLHSESDWKALYRCADTALFAAKAAGRDRVRVATTLACAA